MRTKNGNLDKRYNSSKRRSKFNTLVALSLWIGVPACSMFGRWAHNEISSLVSYKEVISPLIETQTVVQENDVFDNVMVWEGTASFYSEDGCIGCHPQLIMANGKRFNESALTVAFNRLPLGTFVEVRNPLTNKSVIAEVTDTGGFESLGRIIDLSKGVKERIGCSDLCEVEIKEVLGAN